MQNLTTEVTGGSFAATNSHMDIRQQGIEDDNEAFSHTIHDQIARPFAALNFGDPDLAPWTDWNVTPIPDYDSKAKRFYSFSQAVQILRQGGVQFGRVEDMRAFAETTFGLDLPSTVELVEPNSGSASPETKPKESADGDDEG
jgi:phage gp29-like protein